MKKVFCINCKYYHQNENKLEYGGYNWCKHNFNLELSIKHTVVKNIIMVSPKKSIQELNGNNDCELYKFSILSYLLNK